MVAEAAPVSGVVWSPDWIVSVSVPPTGSGLGADFVMGAGVCAGC
jgi:hypothetical protein